MVLAGCHVAVPFGDGRLQPGRIDAGIGGEIADGAAGLEIAGADLRPDRHRERLDEAETEAAQERPIDNEKGMGRLVRFACGEQRLAEVVIGIGLVDEAPAIGQHRDEAGLGAVDEVRETRPNVPSPRGTRDTGTQAAALG